MHADRQAIESTKIKGLVVFDYNYNVSIPLPVSFSCAVIPAKRTQIPCPEMVTQWPHLTPIATSLAPYHHDIEVGLLIGSNCSRAIMPREIVAGRDNEPYAQKTELGWGVIGNVSRSRRDLEENEREPAHVTHRTVTRSASDFNAFDSKTCYFTFRTTAKPGPSAANDGIGLLGEKILQTANVPRRQEVHAENEARNPSRK